MKSLKLLAFSAIFLLVFSCKTIGKIKDDGVIEVVFLQMNDVYEISPSASDNIGGLARVAALRQELLQKNPNTITVLSGDFISPSILGTLKHEGKRIRGKHMVETLNTLGLDWVVFGNHEFDYDDLSDLQSRLNESKFTWFAANARLNPSANMPGGVQGGTGVIAVPFFKVKSDGTNEPCPDRQVYTFKDADGTMLRIGVFGVLINTGKKPWVEYADWMSTARTNITALEGQSDVVVGLTHLNIEDDLRLAAAFPNTPLFMGGHDHDNMLHKVGNVTVAKADANAKTVYIHTLSYDAKKRKATVKSELRKIDATLPDEPNTAAVVAKWEKIKNDALSSAGFNATQKVLELEKPLDCRDAFTRNSPAPVGQLITDAMLAVSKNNPDCALLNSGSIRVDDVLKGTLTELDIVRMLPFGGAIVEVEMKGSLLRKTLETSLTNRGSGGYLQLNRIKRDEKSGAWYVGDKILEDSKLYHVTMPEFLLTGNENNMAFLKTELDANGKSSNPDIPVVVKPDPKNRTDLRNDVRLALIRVSQGE
ncbi:MAG: bifunctional metallophosphatase/5'-nucleotidase [Saprospiraceae bacterium]|nr:bifunctional metallophosphatase/5'-nucleotidase [Saprospiraceae bacterium]